MSTTVKPRAREGPPFFALVMESDVDLRAVIQTGLQLDGHRVECVADCAGVLAWRSCAGARPDEFVLGLGAGDLDPDWETLRMELDDHAALSPAALIVLLTIRNGLTFPARARVLQKPFAMEELLALVASDMAGAPRLPV
jgi:DNA-binding response OmpR family regulator